MTDATTQQAIVVPERPRMQRRTRLGVVTSDGRNKTIAVSVEYSERHEKYGKYLRRNSILHAHDEKNEASKGDRVEIAECRPISKTKHWRLVRVVTKGQGGPA
jgi:small subunit ribosomal protein S17